MILLQPNASLERDIFINIGVQDVADDDPSSARLSIGMYIGLLQFTELDYWTGILDWTDH